MHAFTDQGGLSEDRNTMTERGGFQTFQYSRFKMSHQ